MKGKVYMDKRFKWNMFITSFIPLWLSIIVADIWSIIENGTQIWMGKRNIVYNLTSMSWFYGSIGDELLLEDMAIVDDELIQKASAILGYESEKTLVNRLADVIDGEAEGEDRFIASLILAKEIAGRVNGRAVLWYD